MGKLWENYGKTHIINDNDFKELRDLGVTIQEFLDQKIILN